MSDCISREAFKKKYLCCGYLPEMSEKEFDEFPAADVEPVVHGRWGKKQGGILEFAACSLCGEKTPTVGIIPNFCPSCGAKMDLEGETNDD